MNGNSEPSAILSHRLLWLDADLNKSDPVTCKYLTQLKSLVNDIDTFTKADQCVAFLEQHVNERFLIVTSGNLAQAIVSRVHNMPSIDSIFIFSSKHSSDLSWINGWSKMQGVFGQFEALCVAIQRTKRQSEPDFTPISLVSTGETTVKSLDQLEPSFMYTQLLKEILMDINDQDDARAIEALAIYCRHRYSKNAFELKNIDQFVREYHDHTPIWWYTYECFLYPMLNQSLRVLEVSVILKLGFFLRDLHQHIERLHKEQSHANQTPFTVYRGQALSKANFDRLLQMNTGLLSFNSFLSTSVDRRVSMNFARCALGNPDSIGVLYTMTIDPAISSAPFASLNEVSYFAAAEQEILFSMNTVFRVNHIEKINGNDRLWEVSLSLTADNDPKLRDVLTRLREDTQGVTGWQRLARLLMRLGHQEEAGEIYIFLLEQSPDEPISGYYNHQLGCVKYHQGDYAQAIHYHEKAVDIFKKYLPEDHPHFATSYNSMGAAYFSTGNYSEAISFYKQAIDIRKKNVAENHPSLVVSYANMAIAHTHMREFSKAISYYQKCLAIEEDILPANHPDLALTYNNIGGVYNSMNDHKQSLAFYKKALEIRQASLPSNHPDIGESYHNVGSIHCDMGEYAKALDCHTKALSIREHSLPPSHPDVAFSYTGMGLLRMKMEENDTALPLLAKALEIRQKALSANHPDLATANNNMGVVYENMKEHTKALPYLETAVKIAQLANHPDLSLFQTALDHVRSRL